MSGPHRTVFIFAYYSFKDPIFQSAVLPYFENLDIQNELRFVLLTFEQKVFRLSAEEEKTIRKSLLNYNIVWYRTNWHSGKFKAIKKIFDFVWGIFFSVFLIKKYKANAVYSEGFPGAIFGYHLSRLFSIPHIVHTFEPHADYMIEAGVWDKNSWEARLLKIYEKKIALSASHIMTATEGMIEKIRSWGENPVLHRVPSCVDIDHFNFDEYKRKTLRAELKIADNECLLVYLGKFGGMYMEEEIFEFFNICDRHGTQNFKYLIITTEIHTKIECLFLKQGILLQNFTIKTLTKEEIPGYLSAADFGLVPVRQTPSKRFCSPIKDGEYWACGLPILIFKGISDDYIYAENENIGIVIQDTSAKAYKLALEEMVDWINHRDFKRLREACRAFVINNRDVNEYKQLFRKIFMDL